MIDHNSNTSTWSLILLQWIWGTPKYWPFDWNHTGASDLIGVPFLLCSWQDQSTEHNCLWQKFPTILVFSLKALEFALRVPSPLTPIMKWGNHVLWFRSWGKAPVLIDNLFPSRLFAWPRDSLVGTQALLWHLGRFHCQSHHGHQDHLTLQKVLPKFQLLVRCFGIAYGSLKDLQCHQDNQGQVWLRGISESVSMDPSGYMKDTLRGRGWIGIMLNKCKLKTAYDEWCKPVTQNKNWSRISREGLHNFFS